MHGPRRAFAEVLLGLLLGCGSSSPNGPAATNSSGGGPKGTLKRPSLDARAIGAFDLSKVAVAAFSQTGVGAREPQVLELAPDLVPRAWSQWGSSGLQSTDYAFDYPRACRANGTLFVGGLTASVIFTDQMSAEAFADVVGRDAAGRPVPHSEVVPIAFLARLPARASARC